MPGNFSIFLFRDQTDFSRSRLRQLLPLQADLILAAYHAIRTELLHSYRSDPQCEDHFSNLLKLLDNPCGGRQRVVLDHGLTTACHFAIFFDWCHRAEGTYPDPSSTQYVGLCVSGLAAATISCCKSTSQLPPKYQWIYASSDSKLERWLQIPPLNSTTILRSLARPEQLQFQISTLRISSWPSKRLYKRRFVLIT